MKDLEIIKRILTPLECLPELSQFRVFKAAIAYLEGKELEPLQDIENVAFKVLAPMLDEVRKKRMERAERNRRNGKKGGRKKTHKNPQNPVGSLGFDKEIPPISPHTPFITPKEIYNISLTPEGAGAPVRTCEVYDREKEAGFIERLRNEGLFFEFSRVVGVTPLQMQEIFETFAAEISLKEIAHVDYSDFKQHLINYARIRREKLRPPEGKESTLDRNAQILRELGL